MLTRALLLVAALAALGCSAASSEDSGSAGTLTPRSATAVDAHASPRIGSVQLRDSTLVILATGRGPSFAVLGEGGRPLAGELDEAGLRAQHPELWEIYRSASAHAERPYLDARLDRPARR